MVALLLLCLTICIPTSNADDSDYGNLSTGVIIGYTICAILLIGFVVGILCICLTRFTTLFRRRSDKLLTNLNGAHHTLPERGLPLPPPGTLSYDLGLSSALQLDPTLCPHDLENQYSEATIMKSNPSLSGCVHQNPITMSPRIFQYHPDYLFHPRIDKEKPVLSSALVVSGETVSHEDLSDISAYHRFFDCDIDTFKASPPSLPPSSSSQPPNSSTTLPSISRGSRISIALRDAARMLKFGSGRGGQQDDTVALEGAGSPIPSTVPSNAQSNLSGSQVHLFKQQKRWKKVGIAREWLSGSQVRKMRKPSKVQSSPPPVHCGSTFDVAELNQVESSFDNDHFLHSLESAVFAAIGNTGVATSTVSPLHSYSSFHNGDLGEVTGDRVGWADDLFYPPLPPCAPVVGFAYLGLTGDQEEEEEEEEGPEERIEVTDRQLYSERNDYGVVIRSEPPRATTPPSENEVRLRKRKCRTTDAHKHNQHHNSTDSTMSTTAMLPTSQSLRQSLSASNLNNLSPSANTEAWMAVSDENLLIPPNGDEAALGSRAK